MRRRLGRELAVQSLYQIRMNGVDAREAVRTVIEETEHENEAKLRQDHEEIDPGYVLELVEGTERHLDKIDDCLVGFLTGWRLERLSRVDREILRLAVYEMVFRDDVPPKVVVNEAIEMAKHFGTEESGKFVNGVLGNMLKQLDEIRAGYNRPVAE